MDPRCEPEVEAAVYRAFPTQQAASLALFLAEEELGTLRVLEMLSEGEWRELAASAGLTTAQTASLIRELADARAPPLLSKASTQESRLGCGPGSFLCGWKFRAEERVEARAAARAAARTRAASEALASIHTEHDLQIKPPAAFGAAAAAPASEPDPARTPVHPAQFSQPPPAWSYKH